MNNRERLLELIKSLWQQNEYTKNDKDHTRWEAIRLINEDTQVNQTRWGKCGNCGYPFIIGYNGATVYHCSIPCETEEIKYINSC